jgi:hypothetical protein
MPTKIYWCLEAGTAYWMEGNRVMFAPISLDGTADLFAGGQADVWEESPFGVTEAHVRAKLA